MVWTTDYNYNYELVNFLLHTSTFFFISMSCTQYLLKSYLVKIQSIMKSRFYIKVQFICQVRLDLWKATAYDRTYNTFLLIYVLGSSECQSFCRVSSNIHSSEKLGKMYILEALTKYAMFPQKLKSSLFVCF